MTLNVKLLVPKLIKLHYWRQCQKLMGITLMVETINSLTIPCCSSEWWPELTEVLTILSTLLTFLKATADTASSPSCPLRMPGGKCSLGPKRLTQEVATPPIGPVTEESLNHRHMLCLFGKITDNRERSHVHAIILPCFSKLKNNKKTEIQPVKSPHYYLP